MMININNIYIPNQSEFYRQGKLNFISASSLLFAFSYKPFIVNKQPLAIPELKDDLANISGGRLNKKDGLTRYGDSHVKDKTS